MPIEINDFIQNGFKKIKGILPVIKNNITGLLDNVPKIKQGISETIQDLPSKDDLKSSIGDSPLEMFMEKKDIEDAVNDLPSKAEIIENLTGFLDDVPSADYINNKVDEMFDE